jgi:hypothetical protein
VQGKRWIPIGLMGCVHTHHERLVIERCGNLSCIQNVVEKIGEDNQKVKKTSQVINQLFALGPKHDKIQT